MANTNILSQFSILSLMYYYFYQRIQALYLCLPDVNRMALRMVLQLLHSTARMQEENKMNASSLATVFLPALLPQVIENGSLHAREKLSNHMTFMIRHARKILMPPIEIVQLVHKFYPDCLKNMPPMVKSARPRRNRHQKVTLDLGIIIKPLN